MTERPIGQPTDVFDLEAHLGHGPHQGELAALRRVPVDAAVVADEADRDDVDGVAVPASDAPDGGRPQDVLDLIFSESSQHGILLDARPPTLVDRKRACASRAARDARQEVPRPGDVRPVARPSRQSINASTEAQTAPTRPITPPTA